MNKTKRQRRLITLAAICSSVFLLAACEPGTEQTGEATDADAPTYGDPGRDTDPGAPDMEPNTAPPPSQETTPGTEPGGADTGADTETPQ